MAFRRTICSLAVLSAVAVLCVGSSAVAQLPAGGSQEVAQQSAVTSKIGAAIDSYLSTYDYVWLSAASGQNPNRDRSKWTHTMLVNDEVQRQMAEEGTPVTYAHSSAEISSSVQKDSTVTVRASVTTLFGYGDYGAQMPVGSSWSDMHQIVLDTSGPVPVVVSDQIVDPSAAVPPAEPLPGPGPKRSSDVRPIRQGAEG